MNNNTTAGEKKPKTAKTTLLFGDVLGVHSTNGRRGAAEGEEERHSQLRQLLAELPGIRLDPADCVVAEVELLQRQQAVQPALIHLRQVVVV